MICDVLGLIFCKILTSWVKGRPKIDNLSNITPFEWYSNIDPRWQWVNKKDFFMVFYSFLYYISNMTILICLILISSFQFIWVLLNSQKGVNSPQEVLILQASNVNWSVFILEYLTSLFNTRQRKRDDMTAMRRRKLHFKWWLVWLSSGLDYQNVDGSGDT